MKRAREETTISKATSSSGTSGPKVRYTLDTLPPELRKYINSPNLRGNLLGTGISGIDYFHGMMKEFGWTRRLGIVSLQRV
jgi:hypothetical protein